MPTIEEIRARVENDARTRPNGYGCAEVWDGYKFVWLEATRTRRGCIIWALNENRIARAAILEALPKG